MPNNNRIYFAIWQAGFSKVGQNVFIPVHGLQGLGITVNYNLDPVTELGQINLYQNLEQVPDVSIDMSKTIDGYPPLYCLATNGAVDQTLTGRANSQTTVGVSIFSDNNVSASGTPISQLTVSGAFVASIGYNFVTDGMFTENITLLATSKLWTTSAPFTFSGAFPGNNDQPLSLTSGTGGVQRRQNMRFLPNPYVNLPTDANGSSKPSPGVTRCTILPQDIPGISSSGTNDQVGGQYGAHIRDITVGCNLGREPLYELGRRFYYYRYVQFPVQVTCDITVTAHNGDLMSITEAGVAGNGNNLSNRSIYLATDEGLFIDLGTQNKVNTLSYGGGDTGGANLTLTYNYVNWDAMGVYHLMDPSF